MMERCWINEGSRARLVKIAAKPFSGKRATGDWDMLFRFWKQSVSNTYVDIARLFRDSVPRGDVGSLPTTLS
jgi:hypothetical protein